MCTVPVDSCFFFFQWLTRRGEPQRSLLLWKTNPSSQLIPSQSWLLNVPKHWWEKKLDSMFVALFCTRDFIVIMFMWNAQTWLDLTLVLSTKAPHLVVAVRCKVQSEPVLAADDGRGEIGACEPGHKKTEEGGYYYHNMYANSRLQTHRILILFTTLSFSLWKHPVIQSTYGSWKQRTGSLQPWYLCTSPFYIL